MLGRAGHYGATPKGTAWDGIRPPLFLSSSCKPMTPLTPACSEWNHINTSGSQQHLTNICVIIISLWGNFYGDFSLFWERQTCGHKDNVPIYIHYQCFAFPRVPQRKHLLASQSSPLCPSRCSFILLSSIVAASQPRPPRITPQAGVLCQTVDSPHS